MNNNIQKYEITQEGRQYILTTEIYGNNVRLICAELNNENGARFIGDFSLNYLRQLSTVFNSTLTIQDAQNVINQAIEEQKLSVKYNNGSLQISLFLLNQNDNANFSLKNSKKPIEITYSPPKYLPVRRVVLPPVYTKRPTIYENKNEVNMNDQQNNNYMPDLTSKEEIINLSLNQNDNSNYSSINEKYINYLIGSPKREQIEYNNLGSPSKAEINYSAISSNKNKSNLNQLSNGQLSLNLDPSQNVSLNNNNNFYIQKILELQNETNRIKEEHELLKNKTYKLMEQIEQLNNQIQILNEENQKLRENRGVIPNENEIHEITILKQELEKKSKELNDIKNEKNNEFEEYKKMKENQIEELTKELNLLQKENNDLKFKIQELLKNNNIAIPQSSEQNKLIVSQNNYDQLMQEEDLEIIKGDIIENNKELELLTNKICKNNKKLTLNILYKATIDSDRAAVFHNKCDSAKSTLVLIKSGNGNRFGGFTSCDWSGNSISKKDDNAFIFSLDKMKIYDIIPGEDAIGCYPKYGPVFLGCQIRIYDKAFQEGGTTFKKGINYETQEDFELTDGQQKFEVKEIEVYNVELE